MPALTDPGIYPEVSDTDYHDGPGLSSTWLKKFMASPAAYRYALLLGIADTAAFRFGRLFHTASLEPEKLFDTYVVVDASTRNTKIYKEAQLVNPGKTLVLQKELDQCEALATAMRNSGQVIANETYGNLLEDSGKEIAGFWNEGAQLCKFKADIWHLSAGYMADLKSCTSADPDVFLRDAIKYKYHVSAAWYMRGAQMNGNRPKTFLWIAVEKEPPHIVQVYEATTALIDLGWKACESALRKLDECKKRDRWPGYSDHTLTLDVPAWAKTETGT